MATALDISGTDLNTVSEEERRWVIIGICLTKILSPVLRDVLAKEMPNWYQNLLLPPFEVDKQTFKRHIKNLPPHSTFSWNYESINNNFALYKSSYRNYDYAVKDVVSLAKLFMKPFMASFTGFNQTMDTSAALSVIAEAQPFHGPPCGIAKKIRSDIRNEWAHCNLSHWTDVNYQAAFKEIENLINSVKLTPAEKKRKLHDLNDWKDKGLKKLCFGQTVDSELLKIINTEITELCDTVKLWKDDIECNQGRILSSLKSIDKRWKHEFKDLKQRQKSTELDVSNLKILHRSMLEAFSRRNEVQPLFVAPRKIEWFSGREIELDIMRRFFASNNANIANEKVVISAVSGLGGSGKTSLTAEYIHKWKDYYQGGVYWFSGENDVKLKASIDDIAAQFDTLDINSFAVTLSKTLAVFSRITKPWLMVVDDMDEFKLSENVLKLVSGSWQANVACFGHLIMTTRRTPQELENDIPGFQESKCLKLECFDSEEAKDFVFKRTGIACDEKTDQVVDRLFEELGGLPLALEQACAYIKYLGCNISDYLDDYEKQSLLLLDKKKASSRSPHGTSKERLAVRTTWRLNFEHIRRHENGIFAIRFLNAAAFMNPDEIQKELINVGEPRIDDKTYCDHVRSSLGSREVLKLLTDFSLFRETHNSSLTVHRLVQEVIRENLKPEEKVESIVDAARLLCFVFSNCPSPDSVSINETVGRYSLNPLDSSRFYKWHKFCLHAHEIKMNLKKFLHIFCNVKETTVFLPEVARVVYECALHLNVNNYSKQAKTAADFANRILDWGDNVMSAERLKCLFPHILPLSESLRRVIQHSCKAPTVTNNPKTFRSSVNDSMKSEIEKIRLKGNDKFMESNFQEAIDIYSECIEKSRGTDSFDPKLLSNRASAYLRLEEYQNSLVDADEYINYSPKCWRGYAKKALALKGLKKSWDAWCAVALAFYYDRNIFNNFNPFKVSFPELMQCIHICDNVTSLVTVFSKLPNVVDMPNKIIVLKPGKYCLSAKSFNKFKLQDERNLKVKRLLTGAFCLIGANDGSSTECVTLCFAENFALRSRSFMAVNVSFVFDLGSWWTFYDCSAYLVNCSLTSKIEGNALVSEGSIMIKNCQFINCHRVALSVAGKAFVEDSVFSGNQHIGLQVVGRGNLVLKKSKLHGNQCGLDVDWATCEVVGCQVYDNRNGMEIRNGSVKLTHNEIFHNDRHGVHLSGKSSAVIEENDIFENGWFGIHKESDTWCRVSRNKIYLNKSGGIQFIPHTKASGHEQSVIESNKILNNHGPGIDQKNAVTGEFDDSPDILFDSDDNFVKAKCSDNELKDNMDGDGVPPTQNAVHICFSCHKVCKVKKCTGCFTAEYCGIECQKHDWKKHKNNCTQILEKYSTLVKVSPFIPLLDRLFRDKDVSVGTKKKPQCPWPESTASKPAKAPERGKRFVVKIEASDTVCKIEDESLTVNGVLDLHSRVYRLVRECGFNCESYGWKKMFVWAVLAEEKMVRIFLSDFPHF